MFDFTPSLTPSMVSIIAFLSRQFSRIFITSNTECPVADPTLYDPESIKTSFPSFLKLINKLRK